MDGGTEMTFLSKWQWHFHGVLEPTEWQAQGECFRCGVWGRAEPALVSVNNDGVS